jgi:hypothetical protein
MFGTAVGNFADYPELLEAANKTYDNMRSSFSKLAKIVKILLLLNV